MENSSFTEDTKKVILNTPIKQELPAGSTPRRYEPTQGVKKHNERIHKESKYVDEHKNLPFTFRKPPKPMGSTSLVKCDNCGHQYIARTITVGVICKGCGKFSSVSEAQLDR